MQWFGEMLWSILVTLFGPLLTFIWEAMCEVALYFWNTFVQFFTIVYHWTVQAGLALVQTIIGNIPASLMPDFTVASQYWGMANYYLPLSETMVVVSILFSFWTGFIVVKMTLKMIPTVG